MDGMRSAWLLGLFFMAASAAAAPPLWRVDYDHSKLQFIASQGGAEFTGGFDRFQAEIRFSKSDLEHSSARVSIPTGTVNTRNGERDAALAGADWFDVEHYPVAVFSADNFERLNARDYRASGSLTVRDTTQPVNLVFQVQQAKGTAHLTGEATLNRLAFGLGTGEWADDKLIGVRVKVKVDLYASY